MQLERNRGIGRGGIAVLFWAALWLVIVPAFAVHADPAPTAEASSDDDRFVAVSPDALPKVSVELLMKSAYGVICTVFLLYGLSLVVRERRIDQRLNQIEKQVDSRK